MKKFEISQFGVVQTAKVLAIMLAFFLACFYIPAGIYTLVWMKDIQGLYFLFTPLFAFILFFIYHSIFLWFYNLVAKWVGGVEIELEQKE